MRPEEEQLEAQEGRVRNLPRDCVFEFLPRVSVILAILPRHGGVFPEHETHGFGRGALLVLPRGGDL